MSTLATLLTALLRIILIAFRLFVMALSAPLSVFSILERIEQDLSLKESAPSLSFVQDKRNEAQTDVDDRKPMLFTARTLDVIEARHSDPSIDDDYCGSAVSPASLPPHRRRKPRGRVVTPPMSPESILPPLKRRFYESLKILSIDIGATRTKFMYSHGPKSILLSPADSQSLWRMDGRSGGLTTPRGDESLRSRLRSLLNDTLPINELDFVVFSVPGTVALPDAEEEEPARVRNMPAFSPEFRGFDFKQVFNPLFPNAKIHAVPDNMAAAMGAAFKFPAIPCGLVLVLGTAPAVATFFRSSKNSKSIELAIWQSWAWFTKIGLEDNYGYVGGLRVKGKSIELKDPSSYKIPHPKARIRFALDANTWKRLRGQLPGFPQNLQGNLSEEEASEVWSKRVQAAVDALALKFHQIYGRPETVVILGGHGLRCREKIHAARYSDPDIARLGAVEVPVFIPNSDEDQQTIHMGGLARVAAYKRTHVFAPGPDPLARGWTRGGEIYLWVKRNEII